MKVANSLEHGSNLILLDIVGLAMQQAHGDRILGTSRGNLALKIENREFFVAMK